MKRRVRKAAVLVVAGAIALSAAVAGYAYWTTSGNDSGSVSVGSTSPWQVDVSPATGSPLYPGGGVQTVGYKVTNSGSVDQALGGVTVSVANSDSSPWSSGSCSAADFSVNGAAAGTPYVATALADLYGPGGSATASVNVTMVETGSNQNNCQGVVVPLYFSAS